MTIKLYGPAIKRLPGIHDQNRDANGTPIGPNPTLELPNLSAGLAYCEDAERIIEVLRATILDIRQQVRDQLRPQIEGDNEEPLVFGGTFKGGSVGVQIGNAE